MKTSPQSPQAGIALIIVMICITVLSILAAGFAYSMKVETRLARNAKAEADFYPLAQSAVDYCKAVLVASAACPEEPFDAETQVWAGGNLSSCSNSVLDFVQRTVDLGYGRFTWKMVDLERYANINTADPALLEQAMRLVGVDDGDSGGIVAAILDWIDPDQVPHVNGTESDYYESLTPPYRAKDGWIDDLSELLLIRGITPEMYGLESAPPPPPPELRDQIGFAAPPVQRATLRQLFTPLSSGLINLNTASAEVLQLVPFIDENVAQQIIQCRSGQNLGFPTPFRNPGEGLLCAGLNQAVVGMIQNRFTVRSTTFRVEIDAEIDGIHRQYYAVLRRNSPRDVQVLTFYWKLNKPAANAGAY
ncbi:MAG TPA: type II secretion system protein GspK [Verrucomicrobiota bacterium]|nr:type II secretion system protein GspK [Verrucomicrobiota bacterium]HNT14289.1 type II secretion system protein GspK [Verrucomicrobiota bacterium]